MDVRENAAFAEVIKRPPTGEETEVAGVAIYQIADGTIENEWIIANFLRAFKQLGVVD